MVFTVALLTGVLGTGFIVYGLYILRTYDSIGVTSLAAFSIFWGFNYLVNSIVVLILVHYGITSGVALTSLSFPSFVELFLIVTSPMRGLLTVVGIFAWLWFVLSYTTRIDRRDRLVVGILAFGMFLAAGFNGLIGALQAFQYVDLPAFLQGDIHRFIGVVEILGTGVGIGAGTALLYRTAARHRPFTRRAFVALTIPVLLPYIVRYIYQFGIVPGFETIQLLRVVSLVVGLTGLIAAVHRYEIFNLLPASQAIGRDTAFDASKTAITVLDDKGRISDINAAAESLFDISSQSAIGRPLSTLVPETVEVDLLNQPGRTVFQFPDKGTIVEAETTTTTDQGGRDIGQTIVYNDITDERRRQQRIQVLNRVLRHNLRNELNVATGYAEGIADGGVEIDEGIPIIRDTLADIAQIGNKARKIEDMLDAGPRRDDTIRLEIIVDSLLEDIRDEYPESSITVSMPTNVETYANSAVLTPVLKELLINAVKHTDGTDVEMRFDPEEGCFVITDTGPGIPDYELEVFRTAQETPLQHGSGLGLWMVKWGVNQLGGDVEFDVDEAGTEVTVRLPGELFDTDSSA